MRDFDDRVAVITGAGRGLGRDHALFLAARGARVVVNDLGTALDGSGGSRGPADDVVGEIVAAGGTAITDHSDVSTVDGGAALVGAAIEAFGRVDVVVNNAGILRDAPMTSMEPGEWDAVIDVHLRGAYCVTRAAWTHMVAQGYGRVVNTSSDSGLFGTAGHANYAAAKMGLVGFTRTLALEGAACGIRANVVAPIGLSRMMRLPDTSDMRNETVSAVVAWLAHEDCLLDGEVISVRRDRVARVVVGITPGYRNREMTLEDLWEHQGEILDTQDLTIPPPGGR